jgi:Putative Flp pilus-assembly TadE/G-like
MGTNMSSAVAERYPPRERNSSRRVRLGAEDGQSLVVVVAAMFVIIGFSAIAVDLAQWYQKHHQAQVAADAAALGVADCMGRGACTSTSVGISTGQTYASTNGVPATVVSIDTTKYNVTVTTQTNAPVTFAGLFGAKPTVAARAVANWNSGSTPYSFFAGDTSCGMGLGLYFADNGGGNTAVPGVHTNGQLTINNNSGSMLITGSETDNATGTGSVCPTSTPAASKNVDLASSGDAGGTPNGYLDWPETYSPPTCTTSNTATFWSTDTLTSAQITAGGKQITTGGVYCVTPPGSFTGTCNASAANTAGTIYLNSSIQGIELYGPCVIVTPGASGSSAISGSSPFQYPLVYGSGLSNITAPSGNGQGSKAGAANPTVYVGSTNNGGGTLSLIGAIYAPGSCSTDANFPGDDMTNGATCTGTISGGTVEISGNNQITGFVEAENIWVDKNNFGLINGNGPTNPFGGTALTQ